jgi:hypothetical protein
MWTVMIKADTVRRKGGLHEMVMELSFHSDCVVCFWSGGPRHPDTGAGCVGTYRQT